MHFNPCAPYGARRIDVAGPILGTEISIHAPLTGRDRKLIPLKGLLQKFQSTRPLRGATLVATILGHHGRISIHAPLTGRDIMRQKRAIQQTIDFNPRAPYGARRNDGRTALAGSGISIHAPLTGRDCRLFRMIPLCRSISIHAPLTGRDEPLSLLRIVVETISIHAPLTGRDLAKCHVGRGQHQISIHAPLTGRDPSPSGTPTPVNNFNPRAPYGARPFRRAACSG